MKRVLLHDHGAGEDDVGPDNEHLSSELTKRAPKKKKLNQVGVKQKARGLLRGF